MPRATKKHPGGRPPKDAKRARGGKRPISLLPYRSDYAELAAFKKYLGKREGKPLSFLDLVLRNMRDSKAYRSWRQIAVREKGDSSRRRLK